MPLLVVAVIQARAGKERAVEDMLRGLLLPTHSEQGCMLYALHRSTEDSHRFIFVEKWQSEADLDRHLSSSHIGAAMSRRQELLESVTISRLESIPGGILDRETF